MKGFGKQSKSKKKKISTQNTSSSKEQLINQAIKFHLEGNIQAAAKSYQFLSIKALRITEFSLIMEEFYKV